MHHFQYKDQTLHCESLAVPNIAEQVGTPFYLYSTATLTNHFKAFDDAFRKVFRNAPSQQAASWAARQ